MSTTMTGNGFVVNFTWKPEGYRLVCSCNWREQTTTSILNHAASRAREHLDTHGEQRTLDGA